MIITIERLLILQFLKNHHNYCCYGTATFLLVLFIAFSIGHVFAQQSQITYIYDDVGRLVRVITDTGEAATYYYDAVGNILRITRETGISANASVVNVAPNSGVRGTSFPITIAGFNLAGANLLSDAPGVTFSNIRTMLDQIVADVAISTSVSIGPTQILVETQFGAIPTSFTITDTAPSVMIISPAEGATTVEGGQLELSAQASDNVEVTQLIWSLNGVSQSPVLTPPYQMTVAVPINISSLNIEATAIDSIGQTSTVTRTIAVVADPPPTVLITSPAAGSSFTEGSPLTLSATVTDNVQVNRFTWKVNGVEQTPIFNRPYDKIVTVPLGVNSLAIEGAAMDNLGRVGSATRTITVIPAPKTLSLGAFLRVPASRSPAPQ